MVNSIGIAKRTVAGVATVALLAAQFVVAPLASAATFSDVPADHFAAPFVSDLSAMGVMTGYADGTFKPNAFLNRAEMAKIAVKLAVITKVVASETDSAGAPTFSDVNSGEWYAQYVAVSAKNKIFEGYKDANGMLTGKFGPADMVTRAQAAKVLLKSAGIMDKLSPAAPFVDVNPSDWFYNYVTTAYNWSILDGYKDANSNLTGYFGPNDYVTRGQIAKIAMKSKSPVDRATGAASNSNGNMMNSNTANNNGNMMSANVNSSIPPSKVAFEAAVSPSSPAAGTLVTGTAYNTVAKVDLTAGSDEDVKITSLTVIHRGVSQSSVINGVMVMDKDGMRHGNIVSFADTKAIINLASNPIIVKAGTTHTASILVNFKTMTPADTFSSGTFGVEVPTSGISATGATTGGAVTVKGTFPLVWPVFPLVKGDSIGDVTVEPAIVSQTATVKVDLGEKGREVSKFKLTQANGREDLKIWKLTMYNNGNASDTDIENIQLVDNTGKVLSTVKNTSNRYVTFDMSASPYMIPKGSSRTLSVKVDIPTSSNGSTRTTQFVVSNDYDMMVKGENSQAYLLPTTAGTLDNTFPIGDVAFLNVIEIKEGTLTLSKSTTSPIGEIAAGSSDQIIAAFKVEAAGEDIEIQGGTFNVATTGVTCAAASTAHTAMVKGTFKLMNADGAILHSVTATDSANCQMFNQTFGDTVETVTRFNNFYVVKAGTTGLIKMSVSVADNANATQITKFKGKLGNLVIKKLASNRPETLTGVSSDANEITVTTSTLTVQNGTNPGNQTVVKGATEKLLASVRVTASQASDVNVTSLSLGVTDCSNVALVSTTGINNLKLRKQGSSSFLGNTIATAQASSNAFTFAADKVLKGSSATYEVVADVNTAFAGNQIQFKLAPSAIAGSDMESLSIVAPAAEVLLNCNTISATGGTLSTLANVGTASSKVVTSSLTKQALFTFDLAASDVEDMKLTELKVALANGKQTVDNLILYQGTDSSTTAVSSAQPLSNGMATFTSLNVNIPRNTPMTFTVKGDVVVENSMDADTMFIGGVYSYKAQGVSSGNESVYSVATEKKGVDAAASYVEGQALAHFNGTIANFGLATSAGTSATATVNSFGGNTAIGANHQVSTIAYTGTAKGTLDVDAGAPVVPAVAIKSVPGELVLFTNDKTAGAPVLNMVTAVDATTQYPTHLNGVAITMNPNALVAKLPVKAVEIENDATTRHDYVKGDLVYGNIAAGYGLAFVTNTTAKTIAGGATFNRTGAEAAAGAGHKVATLATLGSYETGFNATNFNVGDVVAYATSLTAAAPKLAIVTATTSTSIALAPLDGSAVMPTVNSGFAVKVMTARGLGQTIVAEEVAPVVTINSFTPSGKTSNAKALVFKVNKSGSKTLTLKKLRFTVEGSYYANNRGSLSEFKLFPGENTSGSQIGSDGVNPANLAGVCAGKVGFVAGPTECGKIIEFDLGAGVTISSETTFTVVANNQNLFSLAPAPTGTVTTDYSLKFDGSTGKYDANNAVTYTYTSAALVNVVTNLLTGYTMSGQSISINQ